jgi:hypothetical protein
MSDWRPSNQIPEPPAGATPLAPVSIREAEVVDDHPASHGLSDQVKGVIPDDGTFKGLPVRVAGDKIWLLKGGKRSWVTSKEVYEKLGFKFGDEKNIDAETLMCIPESIPLR